MYKHLTGLTLTELLIAMLLGSFLFGMAATAFSSLSNSVRQTQQLAELQQNAQLIVNLMHNELINTGFWGGINNNTVPTVASGISAPAGDCAEDGLDSGSFPSAVADFITFYAEVASDNRPLNCVNSPSLGSEVLQVKRLLGQYATPDDMRSNRFYLETSFGVSRFVANDSSSLLIDTHYFPYQHLVLYVQLQARESGDVPVLMRKRLVRTNAGDAAISTESVLDGVERMHFQFGIDSDANGQVDFMLDTEQMTPQLWQRHHRQIISLRYYILLRATKSDRRFVNRQVYQMGAQQFEANADHYRRLLISNSLYFPNATLH